VSGTRGDGRGGEGARGKRKKGLVSVRARAWRALTCTDIVDAVGYCRVCWTNCILLRHR
jgi:hypothetical protein